MDKGQTYFRTELGQKDVSITTDSQRKSEGTANGPMNAVFEQLTAAEAKKLEELVETVVNRMLERLKIPGNQSACQLSTEGCLGNQTKTFRQLLESRTLGYCSRSPSENGSDSEKS